MAKLIPLHGKQFGEWLVSGDCPVQRNGSTFWECICKCGTKRLVEASSLRDGQSTNCGCRSTSKTQNGLSKTPEYRSWNSMHQRVRSHDYYKHLDICDRWKGTNGFQNFLADMGPRPYGTTLDRKDGTKGYNPSNCRWATPQQQSQNRRNARIVIMDGKTVTLERALAVVRKRLKNCECTYSITTLATGIDHELAS